MFWKIAWEWKSSCMLSPFQGCFGEKGHKTVLVLRWDNNLLKYCSVFILAVVQAS
jgi:hypothetical protein